MTTIDVQKPTKLAGSQSAGPAYPAFTKLGQVLGKPSGWESYTYTRNSANGPFGCGMIDTWAVGRTDLAYRYYMVTGLDHPAAATDGRIYLAASNNPESGWAYLNSGNSVITAANLNSGGDGDELAAPLFIDYNPHIDRFVIYPHTRSYTGPTGTEQVTVRIITQDFATFTGEGADGGASSVVICGHADHHGYAYGTRIDGRLVLFHRISGIAGMLEGASIAIDQAGSRFVPLPEFTRPGSINPYLANPLDFFIGSHCPFMLAGQWWGVFMVRPAADDAASQRGEQLYIAPLAADCYTITGPPQLAVARGSSGAIDEIACHVPSVLVTDRAVYIYYSAENNTTWDQVIAVAKCSINPDGSYAT